MIELVAYEDVPAFIAKHGRIPARIYGAPTGLYVSHPDTGASVHWSTLTADEQDRWRRKNRAAPSQKITIMKDSDPFVSPLTGEVICGRAARREHLKAYDVIEAGDVDFSKERATAYDGPSDREIEESLLAGKQKVEQGYYRNNPTADTDEEDDLRWMELDRSLRSGGFA